SVKVCCTMMLPLSRRVAVFLYCNISELNRATKEFFSVSLTVIFQGFQSLWDVWEPPKKWQKQRCL
ncbi:hypothetical protein, partial [uncultured Selenomonas sp.]|uniref:hypothetical protein n=1 Tax=uncultured Selenomonas sp. TaxID=159275 RepID=UPI002803DA9B